MPSVWQIGAKRPEQVGGQPHQGDLWEFNGERKASALVFCCSSCYPGTLIWTINNLKLKCSFYLPSMRGQFLLLLSLIGATLAVISISTTCSSLWGDIFINVPLPLINGQMEKLHLLAATDPSSSSSVEMNISSWYWHRACMCQLIRIVNKLALCCCRCRLHVTELSSTQRGTSRVQIMPPVMVERVEVQRLFQREQQGKRVEIFSAGKCSENYIIYSALNIWLNIGLHKLMTDLLKRTKIQHK